MSTVALCASTGAEIGSRAGRCDAAVVCVNGGQGGEVEGTWSASLEWLVRRLAPRFPQLTFGEVKYRIKSWNRLDWCIEDARAAIEALGAPRTLLLGFSMGGAVASRVAAEPSVEAVVGLAPWFPDRLPLDALSGRRLRVLHGSLDRWLPGIPGVSPASSRRGFDRARRTRRRGRVHDHPRRGARTGSARPLGTPCAPAARTHMGTARRRRADALRG